MLLIPKVIALVGSMIILLDLMLFEFNFSDITLASHSKLASQTGPLIFPLFADHLDTWSGVVIIIQQREKIQAESLNFKGILGYPLRELLSVE